MRPEIWRQTRLGALVKPRKGLQTGPFGSELRASEYVPEGLPVIMPRDLVGNVISAANSARVSPETAAKLERYRLRAGDIIFARRGQIGRCALVRPAQEGWLCGTGCLRARFDSSVCPEFMIQLMQWPTTVAWLTENAIGQTMKNLNTKILSALPLLAPAFPIQVRVAEILASVDATVAASRRVIEQTATVKDGFLRQLLFRGLGHSRFRRDRLEREVPASWQEQRIGELCTLVNGQGFKAAEWSKRGLPIIRIQNLNGSSDFKYYAGIPESRWVVESGDLLFAWAGVKGRSIGPYIWRGPRGVLNQHIYLVRPLEGTAKLWLFETLKLATCEIEELAQGFKSSLQHVRKADITAHKVAVPPSSEQREIAERCCSVREMEATEIRNLEAVERLKLALMDDLFNGRVNVAGA